MRLFLCAFFVILVACQQPVPSEGTPGKKQGITGGMDSTDVVEISNFAYSPADITVQAGDTVLWTNKGAVAHTVTGKEFDSGRLLEGEKFSYTFDEPGTYPYKCRFHPAMTGIVRVD